MRSRRGFRKSSNWAGPAHREIRAIEASSIGTRPAGVDISSRGKSCGSCAGGSNIPLIRVRPRHARTATVPGPRCSPSPAAAWHDADRGPWRLHRCLVFEARRLRRSHSRRRFRRTRQTAAFLDRINDPDRLKDYLESLRVSRLDEDGIDRRKELNFATADLVRLILWRRPRDYPWDPRLDAVIRRFVAEWQDPHTGFFGADYLIGGRRLRTVDLSLTFHMARYLEGAIGYWPQLVDTLFAIRDRRYPNGWLDEVGMTSHNNYDVAVLLQLGWPHMRPDQRRRARAGTRSAARLVPDHGNFPGRRDRGAGGRRVAPRKLLFHDRLSRHGRLFRCRQALLDGARFSGGAGSTGAVERPAINVAAKRSDGAHGM